MGANRLDRAGTIKAAVRWRPARWATSIQLRGVFTKGTLITVHPDFTKQPDSPQLKAAEALAVALKEVGIDCTGVIGMETSANKNAVHLVVGRQ
jgi:hypothetical protein